VITVAGPFERDEQPRPIIRHTVGNYTFDGVAAHRAQELEQGVERLRKTFNPPV